MIIRRKRGSLLALMASMTWTATAAVAAEVSPAEFKELMAEARSKGAVRVMVNLDMVVGLDDMRNQGEAIRSTANVKAERLMAELGGEAWKTGYWSNGLGQVGVYVTPNGLKYLSSTANARSFLRDPTDRTRTRVSDGDGRLAAIENSIDSTGHADVEVTLNLASLDYDLGRDRSMKLRAAILPVLGTEALAARQRLMEALDSRAVTDLAALRSAPLTSHKITMRITREGYYLLREHRDVRSLKPVGFVDTRPSVFDQEAMDAAVRNGSTEVLITLRASDPYMAAGGYLPATAWQAQAAAARRAFSEILSEHAGGVVKVQDLSEVGGLTARVSAAALARIYREADPRILSVELHKPVAGPVLATSTSASVMNMAQAWGKGYRAAGQYIVVVDSGVKSSHDFFKSAAGPTRVAYQFCAGTNQALSTTTYVSKCPAADATTGDSPSGTPGAGEPVTCPSTFTARCAHGTHVAGIAAGRAATTLPAGMQGVAPDAQLISAHVFSYDAANQKEPTVFPADLIAALDTLTTSTSTDTYVVNISLANENIIYDKAAPCNSYKSTFTGRVADLHSRGIPVVIATGNMGRKDRLPWPVCVSKAIKVAATHNDATGNFWTGSNLYRGNPIDPFVGPFLLAPGVSVTSSASGGDNKKVQSMFGTSMAAPHVAGYYAAIKAASPGISVDDATAWIMGTGSVPVTVVTNETRVYQRVKAPNF